MSLNLTLAAGAPSGWIAARAADAIASRSISKNRRSAARVSLRPKPSVPEHWYEHKHQYPDLLRTAVYGLPELHREKIRTGALIANPGCYPTAAILGLAPLAGKKIADPGSIVIDAKSGVSGAGRSPGLPYHFPEANEGFMAYKVGSHRHTPEIEQEISKIAGTAVTISFTPHLVPMNPGILTTIYAKLAAPRDTAALHERYREFYKNEPFVRVLAPGQLPNVRNVRGSNFCDIGVHADGRTGRAVIVTAIDNLVKGASGQAVQNMNLMMGYEETAGLKFAGLSP